MAQTSINTTQAEAFEGMKVDTNFDDVLSREAIENVAFGRGLVENTSEGQSVLPAASGFYFDGVALHSHAVEAVGTGSDAVRRWVDGDSMPVLRRGRVWVKSEDAVSIGDDVYLRYTANGATKLPGMFRTDSDGGKAAQLNGCKWLTSTSSTFALALLEIRNYY